MSLPNLPEPNYFTLQQICERWDCDEDRLIQYCQSDMLEIGVVLDGSDAYQVGRNSEKIRSRLSGFYGLSCSDVAGTHYWGESPSPCDEFCCHVKKVRMPDNLDSFNEYGGDDIDIDNEFELERRHVFSSDSLLVTKLERDRFENEHKINVSTAGDISNAADKSRMGIQHGRELILKKWLTDNEINSDQPLSNKQEELWGILGKINSEIFRSAAPDTIKQFFKKQNLCSFQTGRRKGV